MSSTARCHLAWSFDFRLMKVVGLQKFSDFVTKFQSNLRSQAGVLFLFAERSLRRVKMPDPSQVVGIFLLGASSGALLQHVRVSQQMRALKEQLGFSRDSHGEKHVNGYDVQNLTIAHDEKHSIGFENSDSIRENRSKASV
jgi:hypothetical protein